MSRVCISYSGVVSFDNVTGTMDIDKYIRPTYMTICDRYLQRIYQTQIIFTKVIMPGHGMERSESCPLFKLALSVS